MRGWMWLLLPTLAACSGGGGKDDTDATSVGDDDDNTGDDDDDVDPCAPEGENNLPDVYALQRPETNYCEDATFYDPTVPTASAHWFSELTVDACGMVSGYEAVYLYPNPKLMSDSGMQNCVVEWIVTGEVDDAAVGGTDIGLAVDIVLDVVSTTCVPNPFEEETNLQEHYNVAIDGTASRWFFDSATEFADGYGDGTYLSYFFDDCKLF
jgi:hypothetical protein